ncbi:MAG: 2-C-methyl-D-erythritol 2,4-cyclodiphosphate synthase [Bacteroidales bacterium]|jgi:2-C-methyl-D-erythritol 2,4-cyclodiphosphate synthase|nr:2-C-methyl-D-erythritol 2,4-cyclodiphosphate synthase [Bacteroidales bacterium]MDD4214487.1 2-C-methyl-D-erythritol 2,4-cyclodiphosphate synthase [Bacteroidales bacterium]
MSRIGFGFDTHKLDPSAKLFLGGIEIPSEKGATGHSDADVLIHAICDALLGAANLGDIGTHFPDTDTQYKGIDSKILLRKVVEMLIDNDYRISNIDTTVCLEKPKIAPYITLIKQKLSEVIGIPIYDISVKAKTSEKLGFIGREEGISAYAVALLE